jgi:hypothetical protein
MYVKIGLDHGSIPIPYNLPTISKGLLSDLSKQIPSAFAFSIVSLEKL